MNMYIYYNTLVFSSFLISCILIGINFPAVLCVSHCFSLNVRCVPPQHLHMCIYKMLLHVTLCTFCTHDVLFFSLGWTISTQSLVVSLREWKCVSPSVMWRLTLKPTSRMMTCELLTSHWSKITHERCLPVSWDQMNVAE